MLMLHKSIEYESLAIDPMDRILPVHLIPFDDTLEKERIQYKIISIKWNENRKQLVSSEPLIYWLRFFLFSLSFIAFSLSLIIKSNKNRTKNQNESAHFFH